MGLLQNIFKKKELAAKPAAIPSNDTLTIKIEKEYQNLYRKELDYWQTAKYLYLDPQYPKTWMLQAAYSDALLDTHLAANISNRINRLKNKTFNIKDENGNLIPEKSKFLKVKWFLNVVEAVMESLFYGYSLIYIKDAERGKIKAVENITRSHVIPQINSIVKNINDEKGLDYSAFPNLLLYAQLGNEIGLLDKVIPLTILKRHSWANWDEFEQLFGIPWRIARTIDNSEKHRAELQAMLDNMGTAASAVFPKGVEIEVKENSKSDSFQVFLQKIQAVNSEISKVINGQTMTMDNGSSLSQSQVHLQTEDEITKADIANLQFWLNDVLLPVMRNWGYDIADGEYIEISENIVISPEEKIKTDSVLLQAGYILDKDYLETTYDTKISSEPQKQQQPSNFNQGFFE